MQFNSRNVLQMQARALAMLASERDTVVAATTGSSKIQAYLKSIISQLRQQARDFTS